MLENLFNIDKNEILNEPIALYSHKDHAKGLNPFGILRYKDGKLVLTVGSMSETFFCKRKKIV